MRRRVVVAAGSIIAASLLAAGTVAAQTGVLSGTVLSAGGGTALAGATITIVGSSLSAVTDSSGRFTIASVPAGDIELRVRRPQFAALSDRVRVAAGDTTRATYHLSSPDDERRNRVVLRSSRDTIPGETHTEFIVGEPPSGTVSKPLFIVDGVIMFDGDEYVRKIDPAGIESVEVIRGELAKDRYGPRAANGVIMIRTKAVPPPPPPPTPAAPPPPDR